MHVTSIRRKALLVVVLLISINCCIRCTPNDTHEKARPKLQLKCKSIPETVNYLHGLLADQMPLEEKCKRYAVILSLTAAVGLLYQPTIEQISTVPDVIVNKNYQKMDSKKLSFLYMCAIDNYRTSQLAPPLMDLIECLKQINEPSVEKYLDNDELKMTIYLFEQVLKSPDKQIDLNNFDLSKFYTGFQVNLRTILRGHLKGERYVTRQELSQSLGTPDSLVSPREVDKREEPESSVTSLTGLSKNRRRKQSKFTVEELKLRRNLRKEQQKIFRMLQVEMEQPEQQESFGSATVSQKPKKTARRGRPLILDQHDLEGRRKRKRMQEQERLRRKWQEDPVRYRELARLKQRRRRLLNPPDSSKREAERIRRRQRRLAKREEQLGLLEQPQSQQVQQPYQPKFINFFAVRDPPDLTVENWPESGDPVAMPDLSTPPIGQGHFNTQEQHQQQEQYQLPQPQSEPGLMIDELFGEPAPDRFMLDLTPWQSEQMQPGMGQSTVKPTKLTPRTFRLSVDSHAASSSFGSQTGASHNQTRIESNLRDREQSSEDIFLSSILMPVQEERHEAGENQAPGDQT